MFLRNLSRVAGFCLVSSFVSAAVIQIDFGSSSTRTTGWNNVTTTTVGVAVANLTDSVAQSTGIQLEITDRFSGVNTGGTTSATSGFPINATRDSFYGIAEGKNFSGFLEDDGNSTIVFSGLAANTTYTFRFYASRAGQTDNRETAYEVVGGNSSTVFLNASSNVSNSVVTTAITPDADGRITLNVSAGPNNNEATNGFYYLGFVEITTASTIPEPSTFAFLAGLVAAALAGLRRRR